MELIDTSVWIEFLRPRGSKPVQRRLKPIIRSGQAATMEWIVLELMTGLRADEHPKVLLDVFAPLTQYPVAHSEWSSAWMLAARLRRKGVTPSAADCLIATVAIENGARLIHCDTDFEPIAAHSKLQTLDWNEIR